MATIQINIPDDAVSRVLDAFAATEGWTAESGLTKAQFAKRIVARYVRDVVQVHEERLAQEAAMAAAAPTTPIDVT